MNLEEVKNKLYDRCIKFIKDNEIICDESIYQSDRLQEYLEEFVVDIADIVGYYEEESEK